MSHSHTPPPSGQGHRSDRSSQKRLSDPIGGAWQSKGVASARHHANALLCRVVLTPPPQTDASDRIRSDRMPTSDSLTGTSKDIQQCSCATGSILNTSHAAIHPSQACPPTPMQEYAEHVKSCCILAFFISTMFPSQCKSTKLQCTQRQHMMRSHSLLRF